MKDLETCGITLTMNEISKIKRSKFRKIVNSHIRETAKCYLINLKSQHSKLDGLSDSYGLEKYLLCSNISTEEKQVLFKFRTRMVAVKSNFKNQITSQCGRIAKKNEIKTGRTFKISF